MNKVILIGNLTRDPALQTTKNGISVCKFDIAVQRKYENEDGTRDADFLTIVAWRLQAEHCAKWLVKGSKVCVIGQIQKRSYDAKDGKKQYITEIVADEVEFLSTKRTAEAAESRLEPTPDTPDGTLPF